MQVGAGACINYNLEQKKFWDLNKFDKDAVFRHYKTKAATTTKEAFVDFKHATGPGHNSFIFTACGIPFNMDQKIFSDTGVTGTFDKANFKENKIPLTTAFYIEGAKPSYTFSKSDV